MTVIVPPPAGWEYFSRYKDGFVVSGNFRGDREQVERAADQWLDQVIESHAAWKVREASRSRLQRAWDTVTSPRVSVRRGYDGLTIRLYRRNRPGFSIPPVQFPASGPVSLDDLSVHHTPQSLDSDSAGEYWEWEDGNT